MLVCFEGGCHGCLKATANDGCMAIVAPSDNRKHKSNLNQNIELAADLCNLMMNVVLLGMLWLPGHYFSHLRHPYNAMK